MKKNKNIFQTKKQVYNYCQKDSQKERNSVSVTPCTHILLIICSCSIPEFLININRIHHFLLAFPFSLCHRMPLQYNTNSCWTTAFVRYFSHIRTVLSTNLLCLLRAVCMRLRSLLVGGMMCICFESCSEETCHIGFSNSRLLTERKL